MISCSVEGCNLKHYGKGWCRMHYLRMYRYNRLERVKAEDGAGVINAGGYRVFTRGTYYDYKKVYEHILLAERALGKPLPPKAVVHHMNENPADNHTPFNLVICPDQAYHLLLHQRTRELRKRGEEELKRDE
jgi:hypothetical protein